MSEIATKCLMEIMWVSRYCRVNILSACNALTKNVTRWTSLDHKKLTRLVSYPLHTKDYRKVGFIGDPLDELRLGLFTDANVAGDHSGHDVNVRGFPGIVWAQDFLPIGIDAKRAALSKPKHNRS